MLIEIDESSSVPLFAQIAGRVRLAIADGSLGPGDRLAPARELAAGLDVNMHTVLRAYQTLRDEGLVDMRRSRGVIVTGRAPDDAAMIHLAKAYIDEARSRGLSDPDIITFLEAQL
ncbi:MAG: GntR family transcriptional regulator [Acidimicrobiales bacterium]